MKKVLVTGVAGGLGGLVARTLYEDARETNRWQVLGADRERWKGAPRGIETFRVDIRKRKFEDLLRTERPDVVVHMGFIRHFRSDERTRHDVNVRGTKLLLDHCIRHEVGQLVVVSSGYVYGAFAENPYYLDEDATPSASRAYPEIRDLVEVDTLASAFIWRYPGVRTAVLRPCNVLGPHVQSTARELLSRRRVPTVLGFDPMMQFIHEEDLCRAILLTIEKRLRGIYNVAGPGVVPFHTAIEETGGTAWPLPDPPARWFMDQLFQWGLSPYPAGMIDFFKYPVSLSGERFEAATGFRCEHGLPEIFDSVRH